MLLKNSARESKKGDKMQPRWNGPYKIHADLGKGVYRLLNPKTGNVLKKAVKRNNGDGQSGNANPCQQIYDPPDGADLSSTK